MTPTPAVSSELEWARKLLAKHLRLLNGEQDAKEVERGEWDNGADVKALREAAAHISSLEAGLREPTQANEQLKDHIFGHAEFAEYRIKDGTELGATVWRIALEDIARESRTLLNRIDGD